MFAETWLLIAESPCFSAFTLILSNHVVAQEALTVFQQFREFFHYPLPDRVTFSHEPPEVPLLYPAMIY
jgi:hypothetical protein